MAGIDLKGFQKLAWYFQIAIVAGVCGLLLGLAWYQFLSPMQDDIDAKNKVAHDLQEQVAKSLQEKKRFEELKADSEALQKKLDTLKSVLPQEKEVDQILRSAETAASSSALRLIRFAPRPTIDHEIYTEWPIDYEVVGTYHNIGMFLDKIRQLPRIVNVSNLKITSRATEGDQAFTASIGATYTATTFVYREDPVATSAPKPVVAK